jgi:signal transduction histidine kinase
VPGPASRSPFSDQEFRSVDIDGETRYNRLTGVPMFDATGTFCGYRGDGTDITAQVQAESRAAHAQMRLVEAIEALSEGFALFDAKDRLVLSNQRFRELYPALANLSRPGVTFETLLRHSPEYAALPEHERDEHIAARLAAHASPGEALMEQTADGRWVLINEQRTRDDGVVVTYTEVTELKRREQELARAEGVQREARESAEAANQAKSSFLANVSHELRTPLNAVIGFSEIIKNELYGPIGVPQYLEYVRDIHESGRHLLNLINDILDFSKAEAGKLTLHESEISLPAVIARCRRFVEEMALAGGVALAEDLPATIPGLRADERKVKQMLLNLLSNAVKFTPGGGTVTTRVRIDPDGALVLAVTDTGKGMTRDEIPKALSPFVQLEDALTRRHQGTGLGLPLTRSLIELHGGTITVESAVGIGTTVSLRFPAERVLQSGNTVAPSLTKGGGR